MASTANSRCSDPVECSEEFLVAALLVRHAFLNRRTNTCHQRVQRFDDQEEHSSSDGDEREQIRKEGAISKDRFVDREGQVAKVGLSEDHRDYRHQKVVDERVMSAPKATPITNATASSTMLPRKGNRETHAASGTSCWLGGMRNGRMVSRCGPAPPHSAERVASFDRRTYNRAAEARGLKRRRPGCNRALAVAHWCPGPLP